MFKKLKKIYLFLYKKAVNKEKKQESEYKCMLIDDLIEPNAEFKIDDKKVPLEDIKKSYNNLNIPYNRIEENDLVIGKLYKNHDITFRCIRIDKYHYPNRSKDGYAVEYWVFEANQILNSNQDLTPHHYDLLPEKTLHKAISERENYKRRINGEKILNAIKKLKIERVDPTFINITNELNIERAEVANAIFRLKENKIVSWDNKPNTVDDDDMIRLEKK